MKESYYSEIDLSFATDMRDEESDLLAATFVLRFDRRESEQQVGKSWTSCCPWRMI